jgi:hypothetical protein
MNKHQNIWLDKGNFLICKFIAKKSLSEVISYLVTYWAKSLHWRKEMRLSLSWAIWFIQDPWTQQYGGLMSVYNLGLVSTRLCLSCDFLVLFICLSVSISLCPRPSLTWPIYAAKWSLCACLEDREFGVSRRQAPVAGRVCCYKTAHPFVYHDLFRVIVGKCPLVMNYIS